MSTEYGLFPFTGAETSGAGLEEVKIVALPALGTLKTIPANARSRASVRDVTAGQKVPAEERQSAVLARSLAYFPPAEDSGFTGTSFTFKVVDRDGVESAATYTATLTYSGSVVNLVPRFNVRSLAAQTFTVGETEDRQFPWSNTGDGKLVYTLTSGPCRRASPMTATVRTTQGWRRDTRRRPT